MKFHRRGSLCVGFAVGLAASLALGSAASAAPRTFVFWSSGYTNEMQAYLKKNVFPAFEERYDVQIEYSDIGWGSGRSDKLGVAAAAGSLPDVFVGANEMFGIPLDSLIQTWGDRDQINASLYDAARDRRTGILYSVPQFVDFRGLAYNKRLFAEAGLAATAPESWSQLLADAKKLTRLDVAKHKVLQSGFETVWNAPYVGSEYDWFVQQAGGQLTSSDLEHSQIDSPEGADALNMMIDLYSTTHPAGYSALSEGGFGAGDVAITRGGVWVLQSLQNNSPEDVDQLGVFAPHKDANHRPVAMAFVNGLGISKDAKDVKLAWTFITTLLGADVQRAMAGMTNQLIVRKDVGGEINNPAISRFILWYQLLQYASPTGLFPGRSAAANPLVAALKGQLNPKEALARMDQAAQVALDHYWDEASEG